VPLLNPHYFKRIVIPTPSNAKEQAMSNEPKYTATMTLPKGGKQAWTDIMQADPPSAPGQMNNGSPIVMAYARFDNGTQVAGGVY